MATVFKRGGKANRGGNYIISWYDEGGKRRTKSSRTSDKAAAERIAAKIEADVALRKAGVIDATQDRYSRESRRPISEQIGDFARQLEARERSPKHVSMTRQHIEWIIERCVASGIRDITGAGVSDAIAELRDEGASLRTCNSYIRSIKSFARWLLTEKRLADDPLVGIRGFNEQTDRRHVRRELTPEEVSYLLPFVESYSTVNHNLAGPDRAMAYRVALGTGFRAKELRSLTPESFNLQTEPATVTVDASYSKRGREDVQPIRADLAAMLAEWIENKLQGVLLFEGLPGNAARMLRTDLARARSQWLSEALEGEDRESSDFLLYRDHAGRVADFHATRHTYISGVVHGGASVRTAMELARHSTSALTVDRYSHARLHDIVGALESLPATENQPEPQEEQLQATGTDDMGVQQNLQHSLQQSGSESMRDGANDCEQPVTDGKNPHNLQVLSLTGLSDALRGDANRDEKRRRRDSNPGWRICNPLP